MEIKKTSHSTHSAASQDAKTVQAVHVGKIAGEVKVVSAQNLAGQTQNTDATKKDRRVLVTHLPHGKSPSAATEAISESAKVVKSYVGTLNGVKATQH